MKPCNLASYIAKQTKENGEVVTKAANNWSFLPIKTDKALDVRFETSPSEKAAAFIKDFAQYPMTFVKMMKSVLQFTKLI